PWVVAISGVSGSGTSTVARRAAREVVERLRQASGEPAPRVLAVRTASLRGAHGVATALLQRFDAGFDGKAGPRSSCSTTWVSAGRTWGRSCGRSATRTGSCPRENAAYRRFGR